jgi:hypothetical protein
LSAHLPVSRRPTAWPGTEKEVAGPLAGHTVASLRRNVADNLARGAVNQAVVIRGDPLVHHMSASNSIERQSSSRRREAGEFAEPVEDDVKPGCT